MPVLKRTVRARRAASRRTTSRTTKKVARSAKARTTRGTRGRSRTRTNRTTKRTAKSRVVVVRGSTKDRYNIWQCGPEGFAVKVKGVRGVVHSAWVFGN
jgi:hypothetical protein